MHLDAVSDDQDWAVGLATMLRRAGVTVGTGQVIACERALTTLTAADQVDRYWAGRACLVSDPDDLVTYDRVFRAYEGTPVDLQTPATDDPTEDGGVDAGSDAGPPMDPGPTFGDDEVAVAGAVASERERLRHRRFDAMDDEERQDVDRILARLRVAVPRRRSRRTGPGRRGELDLPRTLDRALRSDGELFDRAWRAPRTRPRRFVLVLDVSGSMAGHARAMLRFALAARRTADRELARRVEVFAFGTRLTRLSDALSARDPDAAIAAAARHVVDWDGGTRIGSSIDELVRRWAPRGVLRGSVVVICSDGLERGDPAQLAASMARLRRHAHRILWVNPLAGDDRFVPNQRGMAAALPYVDGLLAGDTLAGLERVADVLAGGSVPSPAAPVPSPVDPGRWLRTVGGDRREGPR